MKLLIVPLWLQTNHESNFLKETDPTIKGLLQPKIKILSLILMSFQTRKNFVWLQNTT